MNPLARSLLLVPLAVSTPAFGQNQTVTIPATLDNAMFSNSGGLSSGQGELFSGLTVSNGLRRALVQFDIAKHVPSGAVIIKVELSMSITRGRNTPDGTFVHRVTAQWGEGTSKATQGSGSPATVGDATWTHRLYNTQQWNTPGGDYISPASAGAFVGGPGRYKFDSTAAFVADAQLMLDNPASNFGWLLATSETTQRSARRWASREDAVASLRPSLTIVYGTTAASVVATGKGCTANGRSLDHNATGLPKLGNASFALNAVNGPSGGVAILLAAVGLQNPPIPLNNNSCFLYLSVAGLGPSFGAAFSSSGTVNYPVPIPSSVSFFGAGFETQVFSIGPATTFRSSNALSIRIGK